ncbi:SIMPL domain-containing protein [Haloplanus sp. GCM10025708]|uniref:SIMPL domain-containing protein n=1 Tax=Haloferacaceae TaxID=1644056 RepID=UPI00362180D2
MRRLAIVSLIALVALAGCVGPLQTDAAADAGSETPTISVSANGDAAAEPNLAVIQVSVEARADSADAARARVADDVSRMRAALGEAGVPDDAVTTATFHISPEYDHSDADRELLGYRAVHAFAIEVTPDRAGEIVDVSVGNGATAVEGVRFTLTDDRRAELRQQALTQAMNAARTDADTIASAADVEVTGVKTASTSAQFVPYFESRDVASGGGAGGSTVVEPGPVTVSASVSVTYTAA